MNQVLIPMIRPAMIMYLRSRREGNLQGNENMYLIRFLLTTDQVLAKLVIIPGQNYMCH